MRSLACLLLAALCLTNPATAEPESMIDHVFKELKTKDTCVVKLKQGSNVKLKSWKPSGLEMAKDSAIRPMLITLDQAISINSDSAEEVLPPDQLSRYLRMYQSAASATGVTPFVRLRVTRKTTNELLTETLQALLNTKFEHVFVEDIDAIPLIPVKRLPQK